MNWLLFILFLFTWIISVFFICFQANKKFKKKIGEKIHNEVANEMIVLQLRLKEYLKKNPQNDNLIFFQKDLENFSIYLRTWSHNLFYNKSSSREDLLAEVKKNVNQLVKPHDEIQVLINYNWLDVFEFIEKEKNRKWICDMINEAILNVLKHSNAKRIFIDFWDEENASVFRIEDDGNGFELSLVKENIGFSQFRNRSKKLKVKFEINSEIMRGTSILFKIPKK